VKIDLFTFISQIINFIIFVILLYFFLFKKIIRAIDNREATLRAEFEKAEEDNKAAEKDRAKYESLLKKLDSEKKDLRSKAAEETQQEKEKLLQDARKEINEKKRIWEKQIESDKRDFLKALQRKIGMEVYSAAEFVLKDLANSKLQHQIYERFMTVLQTLPEDRIKIFQDAYQKGNKDQVEVISAFKFSSNEEEEILQVLTKILQEAPKIIFRTDPNEPLGLSLKLDSFHLHWSTKPYIENLEAAFEKILEVKHE